MKNIDSNGFNISANMKLYIRDQLMPDCYPANFEYIISELEARRLSVELGHAAIMGFAEKVEGTYTGKRNYSLHVTLDGLRAIAERTGKYGGWIGPHYWDDKQNKWIDFWPYEHAPIAAKAGIMRKDWKEPCFAAVRLKSYKPAGKDFKWASMPEIMLGKCAMSAALRAAFPQDTAGMMTEFELPKALQDEPGLPPPEKKTEKAQEKTEKKKPDIAASITRMVIEYGKLDIPPQELEKFTGKSIASMGAPEVDMLRKMYPDIKKGKTFADYMDPESPFEDPDKVIGLAGSEQ